METAKTAILVGVAVVLLIAIAFVATLGRRGKIVAALLLVLGLGGGAIKYLTWRGDSGRRQAIMVTVANYLHEKRPLKELPSDQLEWLFSKAGWSPEDLPKIDSLAVAEGGESVTLRLLDDLLAEGGRLLSIKDSDLLDPTDRIHLESIVSTYGPNWREDAEEQKALSLKIEATAAPFVARGHRALEKSDPDGLVAVAREYVEVAAPLGEEWVAMRRRQLAASKK